MRRAISSEYWEPKSKITMICPLRRSDMRSGRAWSLTTGGTGIWVVTAIGSQEFILEVRANPQAHLRETRFVVSFLGLTDGKAMVVNNPRILPQYLKPRITHGKSALRWGRKIAEILLKNSLERWQSG